MEQQRQIANYVVIDKIGEGSFGQIFRAQQADQQFAIKTECISIVKPMLLQEYQIYKRLSLELREGLMGHSTPPKGFAFPKVYQYQEKEHYCYMVMDKLDTTLQDLVNVQMENKVPKDVLLLVMYNTLKSLQCLHQLGYLYRDVKPSNFMVRQADLKEGRGAIYLIDLGLCKKFTRNEMGEHIKFKENKKMIGTPIFCSLHTHRGFENSRRDDLQSWIYMIIYLVKKLPWEDYSIRKQSKQKLETQEEKAKNYQMIGKMKEETGLLDLIRHDQKIPSCLSKIIEEVKQLDFESRPNYEFIQKLIQEEYNKTMGTKTPLWDISFRIQSQIEANSQQKPIKFQFKIPEKKTKQKLKASPPEQLPCIKSEQA